MAGLSTLNIVKLGRSLGWVINVKHINRENLGWIININIINLGGAWAGLSTVQH